MKAIAIFRDNSEYSRQMYEFINEFEHRTGKTIEEMNPDDANNQFFLQAYDIVEYPTILVITDGGQLLQMWRGTNFPMISEISHYLQ